MTVLEHAPVVLPAALETARVRDRLISAAQRVGVPAFEMRGRRLHALGVVGVVDIGDVVVEILPKTTDLASREDAAAFLGDLLRFAGAPDDLGLSEAGVASSGGDLMEVIYAWASRLAEQLLLNGTPRRYAIREEQSTAVRGRVELRHVVRQRPGRAFELTVRHAPLGDDNPLSRIIRWLVALISVRTRSLRTRGLCFQLLDRMEGVRSTAPELRDVDALILTSFELAWSPLVSLARAFLIQDRPDPSRGGSDSAVAVLFPLHQLFEAALRRVFREGLAASGLRLTPSVGTLLRGQGERDLIDLRPDFPLGRNGACAVVGDAKWKRIFHGEGPPRPAERDVYQLTAYMTALDAGAGFLISPLPDGSAADLRAVPYRLRGLERPFVLIGVRLPVLIDPGAAGESLRSAFCLRVSELATSAQAAV